MGPLIVIVIVVVVGVFVAVAAGLKVVGQAQKGLVERFGRFDRQVDPGLHLIFPFIERIRRIDMREQVVDVPPQEERSPADRWVPRVLRTPPRCL